MEVLPNISISPFCVNHIKILPNANSDDCDEIVKSKLDKEKLGKSIQFFENFAANGMGFRLFKYDMPKDKYGYCHDYLFLLQKGLKLESRYNKSFNEYYCNLLKQISLLLLFMQECINKKFPVYCDCEKFKADAFLDFTQQPEISFIIKRIDYISKALSRMKDRYIDIPTQEIIQNDLIECSKLVDKKLEYSPESSFDEHFYEFLVANKMILRFRESAAKFKSKNQVDISESKQLNLNFYLFLQPSSAEEQLVIRYATIRILFQEIYKKGVSFFISTEEEETTFVQRAEEFSKLTTIQFGINKNILLPEYYELSIKTLVTQNNQLQEALQFISMVPYYSNPVDIVDVCQKAVNYVEAFMKFNWESQNDSEAPFFSFDDIFSIFSAIVCIDPPVSLVCCANFLKKIERLSLSNSFDYAKLLLISSVDFILSTDPASLLQQQSEQ